MTSHAPHAQRSPRAGRHRHRSRRRRRRLLPRVGVFLAAMVGVAVLLYPNATQWMSAQAQGAALSTYAGQAAKLPDAQQQAVLDRAHEYNAKLPTGQLQDPYSLPASTGEGAAAATSDYLSQLKVPGTDVIAKLDIPSINAALPIRHGTADPALNSGAGHLFGSSLPVGGAGTHAVLAAHSGLPNAKMLTALHKVKGGDIFTITVLGETLYYKVDKISVVKPDDLRDLTIEPGKDYVTLVTCTPINVNTHRLLVRGERIPAPEGAASHTVSYASGASFPYWMPVLGFAIIAAFALAFLPVRRRPRREGAARHVGSRRLGAST